VNRTLLTGLVGSWIATTAIAQAHEQGPIRPGPWQTSGKIPPGWVVHNTKNYHVQSEAGIEKAKRLGDHMEIMNVVYRKMFPPDKAGEKKQTIKLFKDEAGMRAYNPDVPGAAAYFSPGQREMVCYDTGKWMDEKKADAPVTGKPDSPLERIRRRLGRLNDAWKMDLLGCAAHEGWHQYFDWYVGSQVELPSWINEGMGDYFYTAAPKDKDKGPKKTQVSLGNIFDGRLVILQEAKRQNEMVPLAEFVQMFQDAYYANPSICYAQGWALCQFLLHGAAGKYAKIVPNYIRFVRDDTNTRVVTTRAFKGIDFAVLESEFKAWIDQQKVSPEMQEPDLEELLRGDSEGTSGEPPPAPTPPNNEPPAGGGIEPGAWPE